MQTQSLVNILAKPNGIIYLNICAMPIYDKSSLAVTKYGWNKLMSKSIDKTTKSKIDTLFNLGSYKSKFLCISLKGLKKIRKIIVIESSLPISSSNNQPISSPNDQPISSPNDRPISSSNNQPISSSNDRSISSSNDQPIPAPNNRSISSSNDQQNYITNNPTFEDIYKRQSFLSITQHQGIRLYS